MNSFPPLCIGILGAARIAQRNWPALHHSGNCVVTRVASREVARARQMIADGQASHPFVRPPQAGDSYEQVLADPEVDAVYLPLPTALRKPWVIRAAEAGKHVLCEKPCAVCHADLFEMVEACRRHQVQFMDGVMFMHNPRLDRLRTVLQDLHRIGPVRRITSVFNFLGEGEFQARNIRVQESLEPSGCLGDLGWYCLRFSLWVMQWQMPHTVTGRLLAAGGGQPGQEVPVDFSGELQFAEGASAAFHCSFLANDQQWANISGARGWLRVPDFVLPRSDTAIAWEVNHQPVGKQETAIELGTTTAEHSQETLMFRNFARQIHSGTLNHEWPEMSLKTQKVMDACLASARAEGAPVKIG